MCALHRCMPRWTVCVFVCLFVSCLGDLQPEGLKHVRLGVARPDDQGVGPPHLVPCGEGPPCRDGRRRPGRHWAAAGCRDGTGPPRAAGTALGHRGGLGCSILPLPAGPNRYNAASCSTDLCVCLFVCRCGGSSRRRRTSRSRATRRASTASTTSPAEKSRKAQTLPEP